MKKYYYTVDGVCSALSKKSLFSSFYIVYVFGAILSKVSLSNSKILHLILINNHSSHVLETVIFLYFCTIYRNSLKNGG